MCFSDSKELVFLPNQIDSIVHITNNSLSEWFELQGFFLKQIKCSFPC